MKNKFWIENTLTFKLPLRIFSIGCIFLLGLITAVLTYKSIVEAAGFFKYLDLLEAPFVKLFIVTVSFLIALATMVQSATIIWDRLSYWGQFLDNLLVLIFKKRKYYLDAVEELLGETRKLINISNSVIYDITWCFKIKKSKAKPQDLMYKLDQIVKPKIALANNNKEKIIKLLKMNEAFDNISIAKKYEADLNLNRLIAQLAETCSRLYLLENELKKHH